MRVSLEFLETNSKQIKDRLSAFADYYNDLTDAEQIATKKWLDELVAFERKPPRPFYETKIVIRTGIPVEEDEHTGLKKCIFPAKLLIEAIRATEQHIKYVITEEDKWHWNL